MANRKPHHVSVLSEWQVTTDGHPRVDPESQRVVLVLEQPYYDHNLYQIAFNPSAESTDPEYGLLYVGVGDGGRGSRLHLDDRSLFGKILRIDPLVDGGPGYDLPTSNPFASSRDLRPEVWAHGFRNPQQFSWDPLSGRMFATDIGRRNIEEINIVQRGRDYGWSRFEGRFLVRRASLSRVKRSLLPLFIFPVEFPVADYDHSQGRAVSGGFVYLGEAIPELQGCYVFGDIVNGRLFYFDASGVSPGDRPTVYELRLNQGGRSTTLLEVIDGPRVDLRLALDDRGELLLLNKHDNVVRRLLPISDSS